MKLSPEVMQKWIAVITEWKLKPESKAAYFKGWFESHDKDGDGKLNLEEYKAAMKTIYERYVKDFGGSVNFTERLESRWKASDFGNKGGVTVADLVKQDQMREAWQANLGKEKSTAKS